MDKEVNMTEKHLNNIQAVVIGASTGGPKALDFLISNLPKETRVPIFIVQHMPKGFTTSFASRLNDESRIPVLEAEENMIIQDGFVYLAPGDFHMTIEKDRIRLNSEEKLYGVRPAVDYLFHTASEVYGDKLLGIIMTGMGRDGAEGMCTIKNNGGFNIAQDKESCVVYGMPGNAIAKGVIHKIMSLDEISQTLNKLTKVKL